MGSPNNAEIIEVCKVKPSINKPESSTESSLPLTYADLFWFRFPPVERLYFYKLTDSTPSFFHSLILPKLKQSLSATLLHFLPVTGRLTWPPQSSKPIILYSPNDGVSVTVAVSNVDFDHLSGNGIIDSHELHPYVPQLPASDTEASMIALQITLFPNKGFSIGYVAHHACLDGKSSTMFMKAWAHMCKNKEGETYPCLLPDLIPFWDRTIVQDPAGRDMLYLKIWTAKTDNHSAESSDYSRSVRLLPHIGVTNMVLSTFKLTREDINKLRKKVLSELNNPLQLSTYVLTCAYVSVCMIRARERDDDDDERLVQFVFNVDCRARLDSPLPTNYFGNCISGCFLRALERDFRPENAVSVIAERISGVIKGLETVKHPFEGAEQGLLHTIKGSGAPIIGVAGSTRFEVYGTDFGWGKPEKVKLTSIDRTGAISLAENRDEIGGVEVGLALKRHEMETFVSLFANGLQDL